MRIIHNAKPDANLIKEIVSKNLSSAQKVSPDIINQKVNKLINHKIELIYIIEKENITASVFLYPIKMEENNFYWLFDLFSHHDKGHGVLLVKYAMENFENLCCIGVTKKAEKIYQLFKWSILKGYYRYFKITNLFKFFIFYKSRLNLFNKVLLTLCYSFFKILSLFNKSLNLSDTDSKLTIKQKEFSIVVSNKLIRIITPLKKENMRLFNYRFKGYIGIEFLLKDKINFFYCLLKGFLRISSPIYYFSKNNKNCDEIIYKNIISFYNTDKIF